MNSEPKREWVFDGTFEEFVAFFFVAILFLVFAISTPFAYLRGFFPEAKLNWSSWLSVVVIVYLTITWNSVGRWFKVAFIAWAAETCVRIIVGIGKWTGPFVLGSLALLGYVKILLFLTALVMFLVTHLKRGPQPDEGAH